MTVGKVPVEGSKVVFLDLPVNRAKGIVGLKGEVVKVQDYVLHVRLDDPLGDSILPSGKHYPTRKQVEVLS